MKYARIQKTLTLGSAGTYTNTAGTSAALGTYSYSGSAGYVYIYSSGSGINIYKIQVDSKG